MGQEEAAGIENGECAPLVTELRVLGKALMTSITDYFFVSAAGFLYVIGEYKLAFWISAFGVVNHAGAAMRAVLDPDWYLHKRMEANLPIDSLSSGIRSLLVIKAIMIGLLSWAAWRAGAHAGYF